MEAVVVGRRWVWGALAAAGLLLIARGVRAQDPAQAEGPLLIEPNAPSSQEESAVPVLPRKPAESQRKAPPAPAAAAKAEPARRWDGYAAESARTATRLPPDEREARGFLRAAAMHGRLEAEASRLARARGRTPGVLAFSDSILEYRETADAELQHLLHARGMALPMMDNAQRKALNRLGRSQGAKFDRQYVELVGPEQQRVAVQNYERALAAATDPALKAWIERQLPLLRQQEEAARQLAGGESRRARADGVRPASWPAERPALR
jgi:putative membrane protein